MTSLLRDQYRNCRMIYLSWDAASWHMSKKLLSHLEALNEVAGRDGCPIVKTSPLPAGSQFLNVIESVFSGMARAIIHNSNYPSLADAKTASAPPLRVDALVKRFGPVTAVDSITLELRSGECLGLLGPNGAGKSTCLGHAGSRPERKTAAQ